MELTPFRQTEEYSRFRGWVALKQISTNLPDLRTWSYYEWGPREATPLVCLPGVSGTAECYFMQMLSLCPKGYRLISVNYAPYFTHEDWVVGFDNFLDSIGLKKIHIMGSSLGGFLALGYAQAKPSRVRSIVLVNAFNSNDAYFQAAPCMEMFRVMPEFILKRMVLKNFPQGLHEAQIARSIDFMVEQLESLKQPQISSRLTLNCFPKTVDKLKLPDQDITIIDTMDDTSVPADAREKLYASFPEARMGLMKTGGNFPYLSRYDEFNMLLEVHCRRFINNASSDATNSTTYHQHQNQQ